jgi:hypothetical protein
MDEMHRRESWSNRFPTEFISLSVEFLKYEQTRLAVSSEAYTRAKIIGFASRDKFVTNAYGILDPKNIQGAAGCELK